MKEKMDKIGYYLSSIADLALPRTCMVCGRQLGVMEKYLCIYCSADFPFTRFWLSSRNEMSDRLNALISRDMEDSYRPTAYERYSCASALFFYHSGAGYKEIPRQLKYGKRLDAGRYFARLLAERIFSSEVFGNADLVVPVPLHRRRRRERGYNQAEIIARELSAEGGCRMQADLLVRRRYTGSQTRLHADARKANVRGVFIVAADVASRHSPSHILLVDDVFTTGATICACHHALRGFYGPSLRISAVTLGFVGG